MNVCRDNLQVQCQLTFNLKGKAAVRLAISERDLKNSSGPISLSLGRHLTTLSYFKGDGVCLSEVKRFLQRFQSPDSSASSSIKEETL